MLGPAAAALVETKLEKSSDFQFMAAFALDGGYWDVAVSLAVTAAINAADALCVLRFGDYPAGISHDDAVYKLRKAGHGQIASTLARVLSGKNKAQYSGRRSSKSEANASVERSERVLVAVRVECRKMGVIND